mmetsp:Transcript_7581/g.27881  ORF Transcript_7581/g.27881 Transcript_7581/m.27881 type:complete len:319 (+) Transcript_7581:725-1681(+)
MVVCSARDGGRRSGGAGAGAGRGGGGKRRRRRRRSVGQQEGEPSREELEGMRLAKALAHAGVASRRKCEEMIFDGLISVNGQTCTLPQTRVHPGKDEISVDGTPLQRGRARKYYFLVNKPNGFICSNVDTRGTSKRVVDLLQPFLDELRQKLPEDAMLPRLYTVGRLDVATTGLIIVTNDGAFSQLISHPSSQITKEYYVTSDKPVTKAQLRTLSEGAEVDGAWVTPVQVFTLETQDRFGVEVIDGRNREVRVLCENAGVNVKTLKRVRIGNIRLTGALRLGAVTEMTEKQRRNLTRLADDGRRRNAKAVREGTEPAS